MLFAAAAMAFVSCLKDRAETDTPENKVSIRFAAIADEHDAGGAESRTSFDGESYTIRWQAADRVGIYIDATAPTTNAEAAPNLQTVPVTFEAATGSYQKGDLIYAYYPYTAAAQADAKAVCLTIPPVQTQAAVGSTNFNGSCNPLVAVPRPAAGASENGATEELRFRQTAAMAEYDIVTSNPAYEGEQIKSVAYTANGEEYIAGTFRYDLTAVPETGALPPVDRTTLSEDKSKSIEVILTTAGTVGGKSATDTNLVYMAAIPGTYEGTLTVTTDKAIYTFPPKKALELPRAFVRRILLDLGTVLPENRQESSYIRETISPPSSAIPTARRSAFTSRRANIRWMQPSPLSPIWNSTPTIPRKQRSPWPRISSPKGRWTGSCSATSASIAQPI